MRSHARLALAVAGLLSLTCIAAAVSELRAQTQTACKQRPIAPCTTRRHGRLSTQNGMTPTIWLIGTTRRVRVTNELSDFLPAGVLKYTEITSPDHSYIFGDFTICPIEPDVPGHMRDVCVAAARNLAVQNVDESRPPFRIRSTWSSAKAGRGR